MGGRGRIYEGRNVESSGGNGSCKCRGDSCVTVAMNFGGSSSVLLCPAELSWNSPAVALWDLQMCSRRCWR
jgi:hypothetical protein